MLDNAVQASLLHAFIEHASFTLQYIIKSPTFNVHQQKQWPFLDMTAEKDRTKAQQEYTMFQEEPITYEWLILPSYPTFNIEKYNQLKSAKITNISHGPESSNQTVESMNAVSALSVSLNLILII